MRPISPIGGVPPNHASYSPPVEPRIEPGGYPGHDRRGGPIVHLVAIVLKSRRTVAALALSAAMLAAVPPLVRRPMYSSESSFVPRNTSNISSLAGFAAQFGVSIPGSDASQSSSFYVDLVHSREILSAVVDTPLVVRQGGRLVNEPFADLMEVKAASAPQRREEAIERLDDAVDVHSSQLSGIVHISVTTPSAQASQQINNRILQLVNAFNVERGQQAAEAEAALVEKRMNELHDQLLGAEDRYQSFLQHNRMYQSDPELVFQADRLQREVSVRQAAWSSLANALESVRNNVERDTPVITVVEHADLPAMPNPRGVVKSILLGLLAGLVLAVCIGLVRERIADARLASPAAFEEISLLAAETAADVKKMIAPGQGEHNDGAARQHSKSL